MIPDGTLEQQAAALTRHHRLVTRALERGYWQGWDMHPGHLITCWLATYGLHRRAPARPACGIVAYLQRQGGGVIDEPATAQALAAGVLRGLDCGAILDDVVAIAPDATGRYWTNSATHHNRRYRPAMTGNTPTGLPPRCCPIWRCGRSAAR